MGDVFVVVRIGFAGSTLGQQKGDDNVKYRRLRVSNPRLHFQKCNIEGAFDLIKTVGFQVQEDLNDEKYFVYKRQPSPDWLPVALEAIQVQIDNLVHANVADDDAADQYDMDELKRRMRLAALRRQAVSKAQKKKKKKKARESQFTAGMGGGDVKTIYYRGGT